ncbi:hypothetical protein [Funiculus sociatus]
MPSYLIEGRTQKNLLNLFKIAWLGWFIGFPIRYRPRDKYKSDR